jgi:outer membrane lipopolysaccharide assembly protein LptE/RlpB
MSDKPSDQPLGFHLDIGKILQEVTAPPKRTRRRTTSSSRSSSSSDMDAALRRAVRVELEDVKGAIRDLAEEVVRLRRANEDLADKVARLVRSK